MPLLEKLGLATKEQRSWVMYDWANSAFPTLIMVAVFPIYFGDVLAADLEPHLRTAYWSYTAAAAMAIIAFIGPPLGALGDMSRRRKPHIAFWMGVGALFSGLLALPGEGDWLLGSLLFIVANVCFAISEVFYDSLLPFITKKGEADKVSTAGYAIGYLGGGICLVIGLAMIQSPQTFGFENAGVGVKASFILTGVWWFLFSIPFFRGVPVPKVEPKNVASLLEPFRQLCRTFKSLAQHKNALIFLLAFWAYSDGIGTVMKMATVYGREVGIATSDLIGAIVMVQFLGLPFTFLFGLLSGKIGAKKCLMIALFGYCMICVAGYFLQTGWHFWLLAFILSMIQGAAAALSRSIYMRLIPREQAAEFFGFYAVSSRFAGIFGPLLFGIVSEMFGTSRVSILAIIALFVIGMGVLAFVEIEE